MKDWKFYLCHHYHFGDYEYHLLTPKKFKKLYKRYEDPKNLAIFYLVKFDNVNKALYFEFGEFEC